MFLSPVRVLFLIWAVSICAYAQTAPGATLLLDDFTQDASLNPDLWVVNGPPLPRLAAAEIQGLQGLVTPQITFSKTGLTMSGVSAIRQFAGIKSKQAFKPPFIVQATVMGVTAHANPFALYLITAADAQHLKITGNINPENRGAYGIGVAGKGQPGKTLDAAPSVNKWYTLTVAVDSGGRTTVRVDDADGNTIGKVEDVPFDTAPMFVAMVQSEPNPRTVGPNEAVWRRIAVVSGNVAGSDSPITPEKRTVSVQAQAPRTSVNLSAGNVALDAVGNLYIAGTASGRIFKVDAKTGVATVVAGNGTGTGNATGGLAVNAPISSLPPAITLDTEGNLYIGQVGSIRKVTATTGLITAFAGTGAPYYNGDGGPATSAAVAFPISMAVDAGGSLYIADQAAKKVRKVDAKSGIITTVAGNGSAEPRTDGVQATSSGLEPSYIAVDPAGNLYIMDARANGTMGIRKVAAGTGVITSVGGGQGKAVPWSGGTGNGLATDRAGNLYIGGGRHIWKVAADTGAVTTLAGNVRPNESSNCSDGIPALRCGEFPNFASDAAGNLYFMGATGKGTEATIRKIAAETGVMATVAVTGSEEPGGRPGTNPSASGTPVSPAAASPASTLSVTTVARGAAGQTMCVNGMAIGGDGDLYFSDCATVRKLAIRTGVMTTVAGATGSAAISLGVGSFGDGALATTVPLKSPQALAFDGDGNLLIAEDIVVRKVAKTGIITTVAGNRDPYNMNRGAGIPATARKLDPVTGLATDAAGNIYIGESLTNDILKVTAQTGAITPVKMTPVGRSTSGVRLARDTSGNLYYSDTGTSLVQKISPGGAVTRVAGTFQADLMNAGAAGQGYSGDGGPADRAKLYGPGALVLDDAGNLYIADMGNHCIRMVASGTGIISTVFRLSDQEIAKVGAAWPTALAVDKSGNLYAGGGNAIYRVAKRP